VTADIESIGGQPQVLREYALLADGERGAVIGPRGDIVWMCAPTWDSPAVFGDLLGAHGTYAITPRGRFVWGGYYEPATLVWHSRWVCETGIVECEEALAFPADDHRAVVLRRVRALDADARVSVVLQPSADYGRDAARELRQREGIWTCRSGELRLRWTGAGAAQALGRGPSRRLELELTLRAGETHDFVLEISDAELPDQPPDPDDAWRATRTAWRDAVPPLDGWAGSDTRQSYAVMRGLTSRSGGIVAAATTSLPERPEAGRNYDYRYVWIRDSCYTGLAVAAHGPYPLLDDTVRFVTERLLDAGDSLAPAYTTRGGRVPDQSRLGLPGYPGGSDRIGNWVNQQFQLDAYGESLLLLSSAARHDRLDASGWRALDVAADSAAKRWTEKDAGIWEIDNRHWTHSRLSVVAGLRAAAALPEAGRRAPEWTALADRILAETSASALSPDGHWQRSDDDPDLDAALLFPALRGALPADDPRSIATLEAYLARLTRKGYAYRFAYGDQPLGSAEGSFLLCGYLVALSLEQQGRHADAVGWFERTRAACGPPQLFSEEYDATQNQMRGNLPQAFVHALMVEASAALGRPDRPSKGIT
jgi:GH15 family glucan-1,4-alpha-glucosidase